ncbi:MAG: substrate-binding domain-containing protein [Planctomycetota bacterium]
MRVLTLIDCVQSYGRGVLAGMARYGNAQGGWTLLLHHASQSVQRMPVVDDDVRGVIAYAFRPGLIKSLHQCGLPAVNTSSVAADAGMPAVLPDDAAIGRLAADDLVGRGYRQLVALHLPIWEFSRVRAKAFVERANELGAQASTHRLPSWKRAEPSIRELLERRPTPLGVFASSDMLAVFVVRQAIAMKVAMPEQVAVLGVDNDELTTQMMAPTISSVAVPWEKLGFEAAAKLDRMIKGEQVDREPTRIAPTAVVTRQTTDGLAVDDEYVAAAASFIRRRVAEPFTIEDVVQCVPMSRRSLEQRFKKSFGRTLQSYIIDIRIERAKQLLTETDYPMPEVAYRSGFSEAAYFATVFRKHVRQTPTAFRSSYRLI